MKKTYDPRRGPRPGDYGYVMDPTAPVNGLAKVITKPDPHDPGKSFLVEFVESHPLLHSGANPLLHSGANRCRNNHGWWIHPEEITPVDMTAEIMRADNHMYCRVGNRMGHAKCDAQDEFDPVVGAIIALARAYRTNPTKAAYKVLQVMSAVPTAGTESQPSAMKIVDGQGHDYGTLGTPTRYRDCHKTPLCVGDRVKIRYGSHEFETWIVETKTDGQFIMGICMDCDPKTGKVEPGWEITWLRSWKELQPGEYGGHGLKIVGDEKETPAPKKKRLYLETTYHRRAGDLGGRTDLVDMFGTALRVGDIVQIISSARGDQGEEPVVAEAPGINHPFVMGLGGQKFPAGTTVTKDGFAIRKVKSYEELKPGDKLSDGWITVKEEEV